MRHDRRGARVRVLGTIDSTEERCDRSL